MRCYLMRGGHIAAVESLKVSSDEEAVEKASLIFEKHGDQFEGFEVWDRVRKVAAGPIRADISLAAKTRAPYSWLLSD
jgi:hypothetical protein